MPKKLQSQWEFPELLAPEPTPKIYSVSELTASIRALLEDRFGALSVAGEITNFRLQASGHAYFSVKDGAAQLSCVLFRGDARRVDRSLLRDGQKVVLRGEVTVYEARGQYQLRVSGVELQGAGALHAAFEKLKEKLAAEGLFAPDRKRPLPRFPQRIGLVTSPTGAAIRDVAHVIRRRHPGLNVILVPSRVQGAGAAEEIAAAIELLNEWSAARTDAPLDLILVTRGGGSLEDLWAFNEERVARAIAGSALPIISAVGHEIDFTISDFAADLRAATPSAAAEILTEGMHASRRSVADAWERIREACARSIDGRTEAATDLQRRLERAHPRRRLRQAAQRADDLWENLRRCARAEHRGHCARWTALAQRFARLRLAERAEARRVRLRQVFSALRDGVRQRWSAEERRVSRAASQLRLLSPDNVLARGYSITRDPATGRVIRSQTEASEGQEIETRVQDGSFRSVVRKPKRSAARRPK